MAHLFAVYKVENGDKILLGGLADNRRADRGEPSELGLLAVAKRKFRESLEEGSLIVLEDES